MADKNVQLHDAAGNDLYPMTKAEDIIDSINVSKLTGTLPASKGGTGRTDLADMIIETGSVAHGSGIAGNWYYRKYASGIAECFGTFTFTASHYATINSWYGYYIDITYPSGLFTSTPTPTFSGAVASNWTLVNTILNATKAGARYFFAVSSGGNMSCTIHIHLRGLWKTFAG